MGRYVRDRLEEVKDKVMQERLARDRCVGSLEFTGMFLKSCLYQSSAKIHSKSRGHIIYNNGACTNSWRTDPCRAGRGGCHTGVTSKI